MGDISNEPVKQPHANLLLATVGGMVGAALGAVLGGLLRYVTLQVGLIGPDALLAGWRTGMLMYKLGKGDKPIYGVIGAVLGVAAAIGAVLVWMPIGTGKSYTRLFSDAEITATMNTFKNVIAYLLYAVAGVVAYLTSWRRCA